MSASNAVFMAQKLCDKVEKEVDDWEEIEDLISRLKEELARTPASKFDDLQKSLTVALKSIRRKRRAASQDDKKKWDDLLQQVEQMMGTLQKMKQQKTGEDELEEQVEEQDSEVGLPSSTSVYLSRLKSQKKEIYKSPPAMPPAKVVVEVVTCPLPTRDKNTGELRFSAGQESSIKSLLKDFHPNVTPEEVLRSGKSATAF